MPRNVRNFWVESDIDGRATKLEGGPVSKDGGFDTNVYIRDGGQVEKALTIYGTPHPDGSLTLTVTNPATGAVVHKITRHRSKTAADLDRETVLGALSGN